MHIAQPKTVTRKRLLEAAGMLFVEKGFHGTSVRDISKKARANIAAIHYYFRDKQGLYDETVLYALSYNERNLSFHLEGLRPKEQLRSYIRAMLSGFLSLDRPDWHLRLIHEGRKNMSYAFTRKIGLLLQERFNKLVRIVAAIIESSQDDEEVPLYAFSILGQCLFFGVPGPFGESAPKARYCKHDNMEVLTEHIYRFSLAGMGIEPENMD